MPTSNESTRVKFKSSELQQLGFPPREIEALLEEVRLDEEGGHTVVTNSGLLKLRQPTDKLQIIV